MSLEQHKPSHEHHNTNPDKGYNKFSLREASKGIHGLFSPENSDFLKANPGLVEAIKDHQLLKGIDFDNLH